MAWIFWFALSLLAYTFLGYPLLLWVLSCFRRRTHRREAFWPSVSLIIAAHNESKRIGSKLNNCLELKYPEGELEILVASDGSNDGTADIVRSYTSRGIKLIEIPERRGKHHAQMKARDASQGQILIFSDVSVHLDSDVLQKMVSNFADPAVGCVSSEDSLMTKAQTSAGEDSYVGLETRLRRLESQVNSLVSLSGSFFAARRKVCEKWDPQQSSDFFLALNAVEKGFRAVVDPECKGYYGLTPLKKNEFTRKVRTIVHGLDVFFSNLRLLNPARFGFFSLQLISHKLFRWLVPLAVLSVAISNCFLWRDGLFYQICLVGQISAYLIGVVGLIGSSQRHGKLFKLAGFFIMGNAAAAYAWVKLWSGEKYATWRPTRRE
jgi:cellulose synthase/poly-beta-1,6-N-acetylglucosamine synthase-like glycosyltransferase